MNNKYFIAFKLLFVLTSCQHSLPHYLFSQGMQQGTVYLNAVSIESKLKNPLVDTRTREYLELAQKVVDFAESHLGMQNAGSYKSFSQLKNPWISQIVIAAHKDRLEPYLFKYPIMGALPYRGYAKLSDAQSFAQFLKEKDLDVHIRPVAAYSSTGWLPDPILSSMFQMSKMGFIELILHELVHVQFYLKGQADFNEAYATWFADLASLKFIQKADLNPKEKESLLGEYKKRRKIDQITHKKILEAIKISQSFYSQPFEDRNVLFDQIKNLFAQEELLKKWSEIDWNNAVLVSLSTYHRLIPKIESAHKKSKMNLKEFLNHTKKNPKAIQTYIETDLDLSQ